MTTETDENGYKSKQSKNMTPVLRTTWNFHPLLWESKKVPSLRKLTLFIAFSTLCNMLIIQQNIHLING